MIKSKFPTYKLKQYLEDKLKPLPKYYVIMRRHRRHSKKQNTACHGATQATQHKAERKMS